MATWRAGALSFLLSGLAATGASQGINGAIQGRITDEGGLAVAGIEVMAASLATGLNRAVITDESGLFRVAGLPVGVYEIRASPVATARHVASSVSVNVGATTTVNLRVPLALQSEAIVVTTAAPLVDVRDSGVSEVVTQNQIDGLPLNGRQYANLAALVPGVRLGFLFNYGKSTQFAPVVLGGTGRNVSYVVDGGQHNDDKRGGINQLFPVDAIEEFSFRQRFPAEFGRAAGAVLNVVTKSGTNDRRASIFAYLRDDALNARTESEKQREVPKPAFYRYQFGGTLSGPIVRDRAHYLISLEQVVQRAETMVSNGGVYRSGEGTFALPLRETVVLGKITGSIGDSHYAFSRYGFNRNRYMFSWPPAGDARLLGTPDRPPESWSDVSNAYHSVVAGLTSAAKPGVLNELVAQFSTSSNPFRDRSATPIELLPNGFFRGQADVNLVSRQKQFQIRDDVTWRLGGHELKAGLAFLREPVLQSGVAGEAPRYSHLRNDLSSPIGVVSATRFLVAPVGENLPNSQYAAYVQNTTKFGRVTVEAGVRYELVTGMAVDQGANPGFTELQEAGAARKLSGMEGFEDFGRSVRGDRNNVAPRAGLVWDAKGDGRLVVRAGVGRYYDFTYTDSFAGLAYYATVDTVQDAEGIRLPTGSFLRPGDPIPEHPSRRVTPFVVVVSPRLRDPYSDQANVGVSQALGSGWAVEADAIYSRGRDWPVEFEANRLVTGRPRFSGLLPATGEWIWGVVTSGGRYDYLGATVAVKSVSSQRVQMMASYTISSVRSMGAGGTDDYFRFEAVEESQPFGRVQLGPASTDARHSVSASGIWSVGRGWTVGGILRLRSKTPYTVITGLDDNRDGVVFDLPADAATINQARGASFSQLDLRLSKKLGIGDQNAIDLFVDAFNVFNSANPSDYEGNLTHPAFGRPRARAGDGSGVGEPRGGEQRQVRLGVRLLL